MYIVYDQENEICSEPCKTIDDCLNNLLEIDCLRFGSVYKVIDLETDYTETILVSFDRNWPTEGWCMYIIYDLKSKICSDVSENLDNCFNSLQEMDSIRFGNIYRVINVETSKIVDIVLNSNELLKIL